MTAPAKPSLLVLELWGLGDLALAMPFLRAASDRYAVTLVAKPHAAPLLARFAPGVRHVPFSAPWTAFRKKYHLHRWPWREIAGVLRTVRAERFDAAVSARLDPRDHLLLRLAGARRRIGFPRANSWLFLTDLLPRPDDPHRASHWSSLAESLGLELSTLNSQLSTRSGATRRIVLHTGAGHPVRIWPLERFAIVAERLRANGWEVALLDDEERDLDGLIAKLSGADRFVGNDSGPGHIAALLGIPTFTIFGPQLPVLFAPRHLSAAWIEGRPCLHKPCFDDCRFAEPHCILGLSVDDVWRSLQTWLENPTAAGR
jgi:ADP-heptose:LPS heptosyltransferase